MGASPTTNDIDHYYVQRRLLRPAHLTHLHAVFPTTFENIPHLFSSSDL